MALTKVTYSMIEGAQFNVLDYGADPTGTDDSSTAIQDAIDALAATGKSGEIVVPAGTYKMESGITIDASVCTFVGYSATLDFSSFGASTGAAITITGAAIKYGAAPYLNGVNFMQGFKIQGPGSAVAGNTGLKFIGSTTLLGPNDYAVKDCEIYDFAYGINLNQTSYHMLFTHCSIFACQVCVTVEQQLNSGARNTFYHCLVFNSDYGFALANANASTSVTDCMIGGISTVSFAMDAGHLSVTNCDLETGGSQPSNYQCLVVTNNAPGSFSYINWIGNQVIVKNATTSPVYTINGACELTITGGTHYSNPSCTGGVFGSTLGTGTGTIATFNWVANYGSNPQQDWNGAVVETYVHLAYTNSVTAPDTDFAVGSLDSTGKVTAKNGIFTNNANTTTVSALTTFTSIGVGIANGLLIIRDGTSGGTGLFLCDPSTGVTAISNGVTGLTVSYSGSQLGFTLGSGTVPRQLRWTMVQTSAG